MNYRQYFARSEVLDEYANAIESIGLWNAEKIPLLTYVPKTAKILDIGTGAGRVAFNLYRLGYNNITAIDFCSEILQEAIKYGLKTNANIRFLLYDITNTSNTQLREKFDAAIFSFNGLVLIKGERKRIKAIKNINNLLNRNGIFIFSTSNRRIDPNYDWFWEEELKKWKLNKQDKRISHFGEIIYKTEKGEFYFHHYRHEEMVELLVKHGFIVIEDFDVGDKYKETPEVLKFAGNSHMWVCKKIK